jgi:hypothetical protein
MTFRQTIKAEKHKATKGESSVRCDPGGYDLLKLRSNIYQGPKKPTEDTHTRQSSVRSENGGASNTEASTIHMLEIPDITAPEQQEERRNRSSQYLISPIPESFTQDQTQRDNEPGANGVDPATQIESSAVEKQSLQGNPQGSDEVNNSAQEQPRISSASPKAPQPRDQTKDVPPESTEQPNEQQARRNTKSVTPITRRTENLIIQRESSAEALKADHVPTIDADVEMTEGISELNNEQVVDNDRVSKELSVNPKKPRGRPGRKATATKSPELPAESSVQKTVTETQEEPTEAQTEIAPQPKRPRGRPSLNKRAIQATETEEVSPEPVPDVAEASSGARRGRKPASANPSDQQEPEIESGAFKRQRGRPGKKTQTIIEPIPDPEPEVETEAPKAQRGRPANKSKRALDLENPQAEDHTEVETEAAVPKSRRGRPGKKAQHEVEPEAEVEPVEEDQPEEDQPGPEAESAGPKSQRGRPGKKAKRAVEHEAEIEPAEEDRPEPQIESAAPKSQRGRPAKAKRTTEPAPEHEPETELRSEVEPAQNEPRRKTREPRGETVPVTVYRLANVSSLGGTISTADEPGDDQDSADELTTNQRTKIPSRGGVNPADVLSQICRETLEKTLNTLKEGIENEANATRRAEWSRKRRAVEIFGSELDSRLMDLSGMLDSNFVLGVQLKKTKRDMMDLRGHLYRVRRERESVALQMDAVRSKHIEEEKAKTVSSILTTNKIILTISSVTNQYQQLPS